MKHQAHKLIYWIIFAVVFPYTLYGATRINPGGPCNGGIVMAFTMMAAMICSGLLVISFFLLHSVKRGKIVLSICLSLPSLAIWTLLFYGVTSDEGIKALAFLGEFEILNIWTVALGFMKLVENTKAV